MAYETACYLVNTYSTLVDDGAVVVSLCAWFGYAAESCGWSAEVRGVDGPCRCSLSICEDLGDGVRETAHAECTVPWRDGLFMC